MSDHQEPIAATVRPHVDVLVVTAVDVELEAVKLTFSRQAGPPTKLSIGANTYYVGRIGHYQCGVMMTEAGSGGTGGSALAVFDAIGHLHPSSVVMVGIAFGRDEASQELGDLLVAKYVIPYELQRAGAEVIPRASHPEAGPTLYNRATNLGWSRKGANGAPRMPIFGALLSGEKLVDNAEIKAKLFSLFPQAVGGEMEAAGVASACQRAGCEWLVAKSICDWADGKKTKAFQRAASSIAADFLKALLAERGIVARRTSATATANVPTSQEDEARVAMRADLDSAYEERERLVALGRSTTDIDKYTIDLKRAFREGGHLHVGDFLAAGRYRLVAEVGAGGFGTVWRAVDRHENKEVALKVLHAQYARDQTRRERFFRGARKMSEIRHPAVVSVTSAFEEDGGWFFFVMEYFSRGDLLRAVRCGSLSQSQAMQVVLTAAEGLEAAHDAGMVHRDVCPANILVREDCTGVLTDFDLVRASDTTGGTRTTAMGRYAYAAPEAMVDAAEVGPTADIYGLAMSVLFALLRTDLPVDTLRAPRRVLASPLVPVPVRRVLEKATSWDVPSRFQSVRSFRESMVAAISTSANRGKSSGVLAHRTVLIVDDEKFIRDILADFLEIDGASTFRAASLDEARRILATQPVDVALIDLKLNPTHRTITAPSDGLGLLREIQGLPSPPACIVMTGFTSIDTAVETMKAGAVDYISKPFKVEDVVKSIASACVSREEER